MVVGLAYTRYVCTFVAAASDIMDDLTDNLICRPKINATNINALGESILWTLELGVHGHEHGQNSEDSNLPTEEKIVLDSSIASEMRKKNIMHVEID